MNSLFALWKEPFPLSGFSRQIRFAFLLGLSVWLMLQSIQPFRLNELVHPFVDFRLLGYGLITIITSISHSWVWRTAFPSMFQEKNWTLGIEIQMIASNLLVIGLANFIYSAFVFNTTWTLKAMFFFQFATLSVGIVPILLITLLKYSLLMRKVMADAKQFNAALTQEKLHSEFNTNDNSQEVVLISENKNESLRIKITELLCLESADNYVTVYYWEGEQLKKTLLRSSLQKIEEQLTGFPEVVRTHRSWLINLHHIGQSSGNAQGLQLHIPMAAIWVPVARSRVQEIKSKLITNKNYSN